ncbi:MAG: DUF1501 domain-containing protein [Planctomycetes bacterium]|nr:DUF1501 domain-containing protein [Planctomycetota bacterium]
MSPPLDRRMFVFGSAAALARPAGLRGRSAPQRTLVLVQLTGGNDGLSMVVPYADDVYGRARSSTRIPAGELLRLDERIALPRTLAGLHALHQDGKLALFEGVGHPYPNRSHFRSLDIWHAAGPRERGAPSGWIGRCMERLTGLSPFAVVHLGLRPPFALASPRQPPVVVTPAILLAGDPALSPALAQARELECASPGENPALAGVRARWHQAQSALLEVRAAFEQRRPNVVYPPTDFAQDMRNAAALIHSELGVRVISLELGGFDTHRDQRIRHQRLMAELDGGLTALRADLERSEGGREALVLVFSEFGRRVVENASDGCDHGKAGPALALGSRVRGGLHGRGPSLTELDDGDLAYTTDFRSLYAGCIEHVFALAPEDVLGARFPALGFV